MSYGLIGLSGKMRSGKNTVATYIRLLAAVADVPTVELSFAAALKDKARQEYGWDGQKNEAGRFLLQRAGEGMRLIDPNYWIKELERQAFAALDDEHILSVVTDVRYPNEAEWVKELGGEVWRIVRSDLGDQGEAGQHSSETALDTWPFDRVISASSGDFAHLYARTYAKLSGFLWEKTSASQSGIKRLHRLGERDRNLRDGSA